MKLFYQGMEIIPDPKPEVRDFSTFTELKDMVSHLSSGNTLRMTGEQINKFQSLLLDSKDLAKMMRV